MHVYVLENAFGLENLHHIERDTPKPGQGQVLVRVRAVSLNYRDLLVTKGLYNPRMPLPRVPCSDAAGEVVAISEGVATVRVGDRVCGTFFQNWVDGPVTDAAARTTLGGDLDGVLSEYVLLSERGVIQCPKSLSFEEASTLPCAALTVWNALTTDFDVRGKTVLLQGTGGVSIFSLQFAKSLGARVLITSGNDAKLARAIEMGADAGVNYKTNPDWDKWAKQQTEGAGVGLVVEVGGPGTLDRSVRAVKYGGRITLIGVLAGGSSFNPTPLLMRNICLQGIFVGSRSMFEAMNRHIESTKIKPIIDKVFPFADAPAAFRHLESAAHFGKVVITS